MKTYARDAGFFMAKMLIATLAHQAKEVTARRLYLNHTIDSLTASHNTKNKLDKESANE